MKSGILTGRGLALMVVLFLALNALAGVALRGARADLTEQQLYTLSDGSKRLVAGLGEPVTLRFFFSRTLLRGSGEAWAPYILAFGTRVQELLEEYVAASGGRLLLEVVDAEPFSEEEDRAVAAGLVGLPVNETDPGYLGIVASNTTDGEAVLEFVDPQREAFLEYEISRLVYKVSDPDKPVVGLLSSLPLQGGEPPMFPGAPPPEPGWFVAEQLAEFFELRPLQDGLAAIDADVDVLLLVHPKGWSEATLYAIDQYVLRGGKVVAFVDPHCEEDRPPSDPGNPLAGMDHPRASDLGPLLDAWGLDFDTAVVLGDRAVAPQVQIRNARNAVENVRYVVWPAYGPENLDQDDPVTADLGALQFAAPGILRAKEGATTTITALVRSSDDAMEVDQRKLQFFPDAKALLRDFAATGERYTIAARVDGPVSTAFPGGRPGGDEPETEDGADDEAADGDGHLAASQGDVHLVVVADVDVLADRNWVQFANLLGTRLAIPQFDNGAFAINALDSLSGSSDLIGVRSRGESKRPFVRLEELRVAAEQEYLARQQEFETRLRETEQRLTELQSEKDDRSSLILSDEQQAEIERLKVEQVDFRKKLRDVQHGLHRDVEALEGRLVLANVMGVPLLMGALGLLLWFVRRR